MRLNELAKTMVGGAAVYVLAAACSGINVSSQLQQPDASGPVHDASAQAEASVGQCTCPAPAPVSTFTEPCDKSSVDAFPNIAMGWNYAEHAFPGRTKIELARVVAIAHLVPGAGAIPTIAAASQVGYEDVTMPVYVRDGAVAVVCRNMSQPSTIDFVTFVAPF